MQLSLITAVIALAAPSTALTYCNRELTYSWGIGWWVEMPGHGTSIECILNYGANSNAVKALQQAMNDCYKRGLKADGDFGDKTLKALKYVQGQAGASVDGEYGPETRSKMKWLGDLGEGRTKCEKTSNF